MNKSTLSLSEIILFAQKSLAQLSFEKKPKTLYAPINYIINNKGKQMRSILALLSYHMFGGSIYHLKEIIIAIEALHNFSLIHDDVMDNAKLRRNHPTINSKWSNNQAILSGDVLLIHAYNYLLKSKIVTKKQLKEFINTSILICEGQQLDFDLQLQKEVKLQDYHKMISLKTSALINFSLTLPASLTNIGKQHLAIMGSIGDNLGNLFQIQDDYLDLYGEKKITGKSIGGDILEKKKTFLYLTAYSQANFKGKQELEKEYHTNSINKIDNIIKIYNDLGVKEGVEEEMTKISKSILTLISTINLSNKSKENFLEFVQIILNRNF